MKPLEPGDFKLLVPIQVRFRDTDAMGHVNNAVYLTYLELARMEYWAKISQVRDYSKVNFALGRVEIDYKSPVVLGEKVAVGIRCTKLRGASFNIEYAIFAGEPPRLATYAKSIQVMLDDKTGKPTRIPPEYRQMFVDFEGTLKS